jgi:DNA-binding MarR family transcriptional regulator
MNGSDCIYMIEKMQEISLFSRQIIHRATKEYEIPAQHLDLLSQLLIHKEGLTPMQLSKIMGVNKTIISRVIDKLNKGGYVIKTKDEIDKRSYIVSITELGIEKVDKIYTYYLSPIYKLRKVLGNQDFFELMSYIQKANEKMNQDREE